MEHNTTTLPDLQIIGGGLAGLVAANLAVDAGLSVRLVERQPDLGGRATTADRHGYALNLGPHALYLQGELRRTLIGLGIDPPGSTPELVGTTGSIADRIGLLPTGPAALVRSRLLSVGSKVALARLMATITRTDRADVASLTVDQWLDGLTSRPDLRTVLWGLTNLVTYNAASDLASADAAVAQFQMTDGVRYLDRGWASIVNALVERADRLGVATVTARAVAVESPGVGAAPRLDAAGSASPMVGTAGVDATVRGATGPVVVVTDDGRGLTGRTCLIAAGVPAVADRLLGLDADHGPSLVDRAGPPVEASVLDLGLRTRPSVGAHLGLDSALYGTVHSVAAGLAPTDRHLVALARYRRPDDDTPPARTRQLLLSHGREMGIDPGTTEMDRYLHSLTVAGGMPLARQGGLAGRPSVTVADRPGVYLAGDWVGPRGLLADAAAASAVDAVARVRAHLGSSAPRPARLVGS